MKTTSNSRLKDRTLAKYLSNEMSEAERFAFELEISVRGEKLIRIEKLKKQWSAMKGYKDANSPDTRKAWDKLYDRFQDEKLIPAQRMVVKSRFLHPFIKIAAAALILLGAGTFVYMQMSRKPAVEMVQLNTGHDPNTLIKTLADGSVIYIAQNSVFSFPEEFESGSRTVELKGEAFFDIAPDEGNPFIIETNEALIQVLGTAFNVKTKNGDGFELFVDRGSVKVTLKSDPSASEMVVAGEKITTMKNSLVKSKHIPGEASSWYKHRMHFKDETLQNIITVLNRNFNTTFVVESNEIGKRKMTVTFRNETAETITELICMTLNLKSQTKNGAVLFFENEEGTKQD
jgi:ferric-dicitrate binding protein FerR (iron transport regulator)